MNATDEALELAGSARLRLAQRHLLERGLLSVRIPGRDAMALVRSEGDPRVVAFAAAGSEAGAEAHGRAYLRRADAGAVLTACPPWGSALAGLGQPMPVVFDEQARHLGQPIRPWSEAALAAQGNAFFRPEGILCLGTTRDRLLLNAELLEKCCQAYLLALLSGGRIKPIPLLVRIIARSRLRKDQRAAAAALAAGSFPETATAY
jgi:ribulose-5-phosphate 4-epimerase/fuculose-1-phosphate aldolase